MKLTNSGLTTVSHIAILVFIISVCVNSLLLFMITLTLMAVLLIVDIFTDFSDKDDTHSIVYSI
jgi:hypothetical protein